ncbi:MAG TPA: undecaprenyl-diphosphate phosphatase [Bacteroidota bacterium]
MTIFQAIVLGFVQGFTEFLPVSSSGHLVLAQHLLGVASTEAFSFDIFVHFGTLFSIIVVFWNDIREILVSFWSTAATLELRASFRDSEAFRLGIAILVGTIPAGIVGLLFHDQVKDAFTDPKFVSMNLVINGLILFLTRLARPVKGRKVGTLTSLIVGIAQAVAILPGISRSGTTMSAAIYCRVSPVQAARFSFLLALPAIAGAAIVETVQLVRIGSSVSVGSILAGSIVSAVTGYFAIKILLGVVERGKFRVFAFYCFAVGIIGILFI